MIWGKEDYQKQTHMIISDLFDNFDGPEFIPALSEMCAKTLVISAEQNFETSNPNPQKKKQFPGFSKEQIKAYQDHDHICSLWRAAGRPQSNLHPAKAAKLESQRFLQRLSRENESAKALKLHNELMETHAKDFSKVCSKLKKIRGDKSKSIDIPTIETLCGTFEGENVLEGFCANTEKLCNETSAEAELNNEFYTMCAEDNMIIFELTGQDQVKIPHMQLSDLKDIIFKRLKLNKACDIFKLTVEHLRYAGDQTLILIAKLLNSIIDHLNYLSSPQLNTAVATIVYKGKGKPVYHHKSYRQVRVTPLLGRLLDEFLRPVKIKSTRHQQNKNQYGFSENISYMMGALQRHEVEKYCIDNKLTFFGCSLDGESAFEVVDRTIQLRELYCAGETGEFWKSSKYSYDNSLTQIKMKGKLSRQIEETLGVKQGHINSSDNYKIYINPALNTFEESTLGVWMGPINVSVTGVADDIYLMADTQSKLQALINLAEHYGHRYKIKYGAAKTKITVVGSDIDMDYYSDTTPWRMGGDTVKVVENNDHLGQIVSGTRQEDKNVDERLKKGRNSLFSLLGAGFAFKCMLGPLVKIHLFRTFTCPIIRSGLSSFALRTHQMSPLSLFHRKTLKSFLHLSKTAPTPAIHFLLGELPMEGKIHRDMFSLFYSVWTNPNTKIFEILKYLLETSSENSRTWAINLRHISKMYSLEDPLTCLLKGPPSKSQFKETVLTKISAFHENELRRMAATNSKMGYLNVGLLGLRGKHHPSLLNIITTEDVKKSRLHLKFLSGDYLTYQTKFDQSGKGSPLCKICRSENETISHIISICPAFSDIRLRIFQEISVLCLRSKSKINFQDTLHNPENLTQFILDPTSFNLEKRVHISDPVIEPLFKLSRDLCFSIHTERMRQLKNLQDL